MVNLIALSIFVGLLIIAVIYGLTLYIKDRLKPSNKELVDELYNRQLIDKEEYQKTVEIAIKKDK